jgi:hypothetical protein
MSLIAIEDENARVNAPDAGIQNGSPVGLAFVCFGGAVVASGFISH